MASDKPIGVFDSGLGGVSVLKEALAQLPNENYIYYGDNLHAPYGDRSEAEISQFTYSCADILMQKGVKAILLACNTATATCIYQIRAMFNIPVISIEPAIKPACEHPGDGKVLMLATTATTTLERYQMLQRRMPDPDRVINVPCPGLVDRIERGIFDDDAFDDLLERYLAPYEGMKVDGIVLGCTHYIFIKNAVSRYAKAHFNGDCLLYDGNRGTVRQMGVVLRQRGIESYSGSANVEFYTSGDPERVYPLFKLLIER